MFEALKLKNKLVLVSILEQLPVRGIVNSGYIFNKKREIESIELSWNDWNSLEMLSVLCIWLL